MIVTTLKPLLAEEGWVDGMDALLYAQQHNIEGILLNFQITLNRYKTCNRDVAI